MLDREGQEELPLTLDEEETALATRLGPDGLRAIDAALTSVTRPVWMKVARVIVDALKAGGFPTADVYIRLHNHRVIALIEAGVLEVQGNPRWPRFSEVRLPGTR